jgi:hypothetical protein
VSECEAQSVVSGRSVVGVGGRGSGRVVGLGLGL